MAELLILSLLIVISLLFLWKKKSPFGQNQKPKSYEFTWCKQNWQYKMLIWKNPDGSFEFFVHHEDKIWNLSTEVPWVSSLHELCYILQFETSHKAHIENDEKENALNLIFEPKGDRTQQNLRLTRILDENRCFRLEAIFTKLMSQEGLPVGWYSPEHLKSGKQSY